MEFSEIFADNHPAARFLRSIGLDMVRSDAKVGVEYLPKNQSVLQLGSSFIAVLGMCSVWFEDQDYQFCYITPFNFYLCFYDIFLITLELHLKRNLVYCFRRRKKFVKIFLLHSIYILRNIIWHITCILVCMINIPYFSILDQYILYFSWKCCTGTHCDRFNSCPNTS